MTKTLTPYLGCDANNPTRASQFDVQGCDVSQAQGEYDWDAAISAGAKFAFCRCAVGYGDVDKQWDRNWKAMHDRGIIRGVYAANFADTRAAGKSAEDDAYDEASFLCEKIIEAENQLHDGEPLKDGRCLPVVPDFERKTPQSAKEDRAWILKWIRTVQDALGRGTIIYTGDQVWAREMDGDPFLKDLPLWVPHYSNGRVPTMRPWTRWVFWQWSGGGNGDVYRKLNGHAFPGAKGNSVDVNAYSGTLEDLEAMCLPGNDMWLHDDGVIALRHANPLPPSSDHDSATAEQLEVIEQELLMSRRFNEQALERVRQLRNRISLGWE